MTTKSNNLKVGIVQSQVGLDKDRTNSYMIESIQKLVLNNPKTRLVILPECFNCPYGTEYFAKYAEPIPSGATCKLLSKVAKQLNIYIIGGSIIEIDAKKKLYNTCTVWSPNGELIGKHRKIHLFDMDVVSEGGGMIFHESSVLTPGSDLTIVDIDGKKCGIGICFDIRFEELARIYRNLGCDMIIYPSAFDVSQGSMYWTLLQQARAIDNQVFVGMVSSARNIDAGYVAYGHSMIVDPWGKVIKEASADEEFFTLDLDFTRLVEVRQQIKLFKQRRTDIYDTKQVN